MYVGVLRAKLVSYSLPEAPLHSHLDHIPTLSHKRGGHKGPSGGYKGPKPALSKIYKLGSTNLYLTYGGRLLSTLTCGPYGLHSARRDDTAGRFATTTCVCVCVWVVEPFWLKAQVVASAGHLLPDDGAMAKVVRGCTR